MRPVLDEVDGVVWWGNFRHGDQRDGNRRFVVANLLDDIGVTEWHAADLLSIAETWAALLRDALQRAYPDRVHVVEIVGAAGVDDEPLELCVTFYQ